MQYRVFFGCSNLGVARCSEPFETEDTAREHMHDKAKEMAVQMGVDINNPRFFRLNPTSYQITTGSGATYSGCLIPANENV